MNPANRNKAYEVTWLIRRAFRAMAAVADRYLAESGLCAAERAVMEFLYPDTALSVPAIARRHDVSRQHVQVTVNGLLDKGLVTRVENPRHRRSRLIRLSGPGRDTFIRIRRDEDRVLDEVFAGIGETDLDATRQTLSALLHNLKQGRNHASS